MAHGVHSKIRMWKIRLLTQTVYRLFGRSPD